nr:hypothetical protein [Tanacetum cinerariifolium]
VHGQAQVIDQELQTPLDDLAVGELHAARCDEAQAAGREVFDTHQRCVWLAIEQAQFGWNLDPGVLALGFGFMDDVRIHGCIHGGNS